VTVTSACTNTNVPQVGDRLPLPDSLALGGEQDKLDADLRTSALLGTPSVLTDSAAMLVQLPNGNDVFPADEGVLHYHGSFRP